MTKPIRIGIVGSRYAAQFHYTAYQRVTGIDVKVVGITSLNREHREDFMANTQEELDKMLDEYYKLHGWDLKTSWPTRKTLEKLGLNFVGEELGKKGKLPSPGNIKISVKA